MRISRFNLTLIIVVAMAGSSLIVYGVISELERKGVCTTQEVIEVYGNGIRTPVFSAFFTMGSFLIALKSSIIARIKETYDTSSHMVHFQSERARNPDAKFYSGLELLSVALGVNVILCLASSLVQMVFGFIESRWSVSICIGVPVLTFSLLIYLTDIIIKSHRNWFDKMNEEAEEKADALSKENEEERKKLIQS